MQSNLQSDLQVSAWRFLNFRILFWHSDSTASWLRKNTHCSPLKDKLTELRALVKIWSNGLFWYAITHLYPHFNCDLTPMDYRGKQCIPKMESFQVNKIMQHLVIMGGKLLTWVSTPDETAGHIHRILYIAQLGNANNTGKRLCGHVFINTNYRRYGNAMIQPHHSGMTYVRLTGN